MKYWYMLVEEDCCELPKCPPFESLSQIADYYGYKMDTVAKAIKRKSVTPLGKFVRITAPKERKSRKKKAKKGPSKG